MAATPTRRSTCGSTGRVSNRGGVGIEDRPARRQPAPAARDRRRRRRRSRRPTSCFGLGARDDRATSIRVLWPSGTVQTEVDTGAGGTTARPLAAGTLAVGHRARSQAVVVPVPLHLERHPVRVRDRLHGRRRARATGWGRASGTQPDPDEYVRIRGDQLKPRDGRYELRVTNELEETLFVDRAAARGRRSSGRRRGLSRTRA